MNLSDSQKVRLLGAEASGSLDGRERIDASLVKRGLIEKSDGRLWLTERGQTIRIGLLQ